RRNRRRRPRSLHTSRRFGAGWTVPGSFANIAPPFALLHPPARTIPSRPRERVWMQQRQLRLGDILDDYCPRERRVTNHAVVAMVGADVKQTRCTTCDAEHEYKHAKIPRQRSKNETPAALYQQVAAAARKRVTHDAQDADVHPDAPEPVESA